MKKIYSPDEIPENEEVWLIKDRFGWKVINPYKHPKTNKITWQNLLWGGKRGLLTTIIYILIAVLLYYGVNDLISDYKDAAENPCSYCQLSSQYNEDAVKNLRLSGGINLSAYNSNLTEKIVQKKEGD